MTGPLTIVPVLGVPEVGKGDDVAALLVAALGEVVLCAGDVVVVSSKVVSKALGLRGSDDNRGALVLRESRRVVAERASGDQVTRVVEARSGPVMAAAGVDASNTGPSGQVLLLPHDPDACARDLRAALLCRAGMPAGSPLAVVLSDTAGRPWRAGLTDFALGAAGLRVLLDHRGEGDVDGRPLAVTARAVADEIASAADLVKGKADGVAAAVVRGLPHSWFETDGDDVGDVGDDVATERASSPGRRSGARDLVRVGSGDWFALGHVEALRAALGVLPGTPESEAVGIRSVGPESLDEKIARVVALALLADEDATLDLELVGESLDPRAGPDGDENSSVVRPFAVVTLGATDTFRLGRLSQRLEVAAASEDLVTCDWSEPTAEHGITVTLGHPRSARGPVP